MIYQKDHVIDVYDEIATHFDVTRAYIWKGVKNFIENLNQSDMLLEIGSGNGKNLLVRKDIFNFGFDISHEMLKICKNKNIECIEGDAIYLPFRDNYFNATMSVAVIHHISDLNARIKAIQEMTRITKVGGKIFIQVWNNFSKKKTKKYTKLENNGDYLIEWQTQDSKKFYRYYHLFEKDEFLEMITKVNSVKIESISEECNNWIAILIKT